jgi:hypothetical protein
LLAPVAAQEKAQVHDADQRCHAAHGCGYQGREMKQVLDQGEIDSVGLIHAGALPRMIVLYCLCRVK